MTVLIVGAGICKEGEKKDIYAILNKFLLNSFEVSIADTILLKLTNAMP
jgi:hypothetical protein